MSLSTTVVMHTGPADKEASVIPTAPAAKLDEQSLDDYPPGTTVMLVDDYGPIRESLRLFLEHVMGVTTVRETGYGRDAIELAERIQPDVIITDGHLPDVSGVEVVRNISRLSPASRMLFINAADDQFSSAYEAGADVCMLKDSNLFDAVRQLLPELVAAARPATANR